MITLETAFFKMGCSIKNGTKNWEKSGFTGAVQYGMINMLGGLRGRLFCAMGRKLLEESITAG